MSRIPYIRLCMNCIPSKYQSGSPLQPGDTLHVPTTNWEKWGTREAFPEAFQYRIVDIKDCENQA